MSFCVLDASVALAWSFADETSPYAEAVMGSLRARRATVPSIWPIEINNALLTAIRRKRLGQTEAFRLIGTLFRLAIDIDPTIAHAAIGQRILELGLVNNLSSYDASYLELALRRGLPLATQDARLAAAAVNTGVKIFHP